MGQYEAPMTAMRDSHKRDQSMHSSAMLCTRCTLRICVHGQYLCTSHTTSVLKPLPGEELSTL